MKNKTPQSFRTPVIMLTLTLVLALPAAQVFAAADAYPTKVVRLVCVSDVGANTDVFSCNHDGCLPVFAHILSRR